MRDATADAPGRVNLIGEHTDYQEGFVLPCVLPQRTTATVRPRADRRVSARSADVEGIVEYELGRETTGLGWGDYVQGVTYALVTAGHTISGFDLAIHSTVPPGSGLSSSAALEVSILRALRGAFGLVLDPVQIATIAQRAEVEFVGARVGIMDQMASSIGRPSHALFLDTRSLAYEEIPLPRDLGLVIIDSGVTHQHVTGGYQTRRAEAEEAARQLGVRTLRDASSDEAALDGLPDLLRKRARHIVTENARVLRAADALRAADLELLGRLFVASHASMRDDYEVSTPEIDLLVDLALAHRGVYGARLTGGGFGGSVVIAAAATEAHEVANAVSRTYSERSGKTGTVRLPVS